jgi:type VI secretion system secreted protein Hcp
MAADMFLNLDGIKGESQDSKHKGEIEILSFSWGMAQVGAGHRGTGSGAGKVEIADITFSKYIDKSSPSLMTACASGDHIAKGKFTVRKAGGTPLDYVTLDMEKIFVAGYQTGGSGGSELLTETVTLNFVKVKLEYWTQTDKGAKGENANFSWDIAQHEKF